jgi:hypothetical protein
MEDTTRRRILSTGGALAAGSLTALSGCTEDLPIGGEDGDGDGSSIPAFGLWLYAPGEVGLGEYAYAYADVTATSEHSEFDLARQPDLSTIARVLQTGELDGIESAVSIEYPDTQAFGVAAEGSLDLTELRSQIEGEVEDNDDVDSESYADYDVYFDGSVAFALAQNDSAILQAVGPDGEDTSGKDILTAMIDARQGSATRLDAADEDAAALLSHQSDGVVAYGTTRPSEHKPRMFDSADDEAPDIVGGGYVIVALGDDVKRRLLVVTESPVEDAESFGETLSSVDLESDLTFEQDGRVVTVVVESGGGSSSESDSTSPPQVQFDARFDTNESVATITHEGGDDARADELELVFETDEPRVISWADRSAREEVTAGTSVEVELREDDFGGQLLVRWIAGDRSTTLTRFDIPVRQDGGSDQPDESDGSVPSVSMDAEFDFERGEVTVIHAAGDEVPADELDIVFLGDQYRVIRWSEVSDQSTVTPGDSATVELREGDYGEELLLGWQPETRELDSVQIPEP